MYGGKDKAVAASLSSTGDKEDMARFATEIDEVYRQFAEAMQTGDEDLKEEALRRLAESNKAVWHFENVRYYLLQLADTFDGIPELIEATDREYGVGVTGYIAKAIREHYGVS